VNDVLVEAQSRSRNNSREPVPAQADGIRRPTLLGNTGLDIMEEDNVINLKMAYWNKLADLLITVPRRSSVQLKCLGRGDIYVERVEGEIDVETLSGKITLKDVSGAVVAHSLNGAVLATLERVDPSKPLSFSTFNSNIDVTLPDNLRANLRIKTDHGQIYSGFEIKFDLDTTSNNLVRRPPEAYHPHTYRTQRGTIGGAVRNFHSLLSTAKSIFAKTNKSTVRKTYRLAFLQSSDGPGASLRRTAVLLEDVNHFADR